MFLQASVHFFFLNISFKAIRGKENTQRTSVGLLSYTKSSPNAQSFKKEKVAQVLGYKDIAPQMWLSISGELQRLS